MMRVLGVLIFSCFLFCVLTGDPFVFGVAFDVSLFKYLISAIELGYAQTVGTQVREAFQQLVEVGLINNIWVNNLMLKLLADIVVVDIEFEGHLVLLVEDLLPLYVFEPLEPPDLVEAFESLVHIALNEAGDDLGELARRGLLEEQGLVVVIRGHSVDQLVGETAQGVEVH